MVNDIYDNPSFGGPWVDSIAQKRKVKAILDALETSLDNCLEKPMSPEARSALAELNKIGFGKLAKKFETAMSSPYPEVRLDEATAVLEVIKGLLSKAS